MTRQPAYREIADLEFDQRLERDPHAIYNRHVDQPYGRAYAAKVGAKQERLLAEGATADLDEAFAQAVAAVEPMVPTLRAQQEARA